MNRYRGNAGAVRNLIRETEVHRDVYIDEEVFQLEMEHLFANTWVYVGHDSQVPNEGDYYGTTIGTGRVNFAPSQKNTLVINTASNASGWAATISNPGYSPGSCGVFVGSTFSGSGTPAAATQEGVPVCP